MKKFLEIIDIVGREIMDSRGNPTVEVEVYVEDGVIYAGDDWEDDMEGENFTLDGDSLILESITEEFGTEQAFTRVAE